MRAGDVLDERFRVERQIASGGMGTVFLAQDRLTGTRVAVKALGTVSEAATERFRREARVLAALSHRNIVRYVAHGQTSVGEPYLVMEWLEGEDLARTLKRTFLTPKDAVEIVAQAAAALAFAHSQGVVHRDIKPSNLFLVGDSPRTLKLIDFGVARPRERSLDLTGSSTWLGTFGYMAPEQVTNSATVDDRADVFSLGCVLFECLTGRPVFDGDNAVALIAKVLAADAPRVSSVSPELGEAFDDLVSNMLVKTPSARLHSAAAVITRLESLDLAEQPPATSTAASRPLGDAEQAIISVVIAALPSFERALGTADADDPSLLPARQLATRFQAKMSALGRGACVLVISAGVAATDRAAQAASLSLALAADDPRWCVAVATGVGDATGPVPIGASIDRAAELLAVMSSTPAASGARVAIDATTANLLGPRFVVDGDAGRLLLHGERRDSEQPRPLLGKRTPCVGREKELALLEMTLREVMTESVARSVLVTAPPGVGKSRVRMEFVTRARTIPNACVVVVRADPTEARSPLSLLRHIVREMTLLYPADSAAAQAAHFRSYLSRILPDERARQVFRFPRGSTGHQAAGRREPSSHRRSQRLGDHGRPAKARVRSVARRTHRAYADRGRTRGSALGGWRIAQLPGYSPRLRGRATSDDRRVRSSGVS